MPQEVQPEVVNTDLSTDLLGESLSLPVTASVPQSASHDLLGGDLDFMGGDFGGNVDAPAVSTAAVALLPGAVLDGGVFQAKIHDLNFELCERHSALHVERVSLRVSGQLHDVNL